MTASICVNTEHIREITGMVASLRVSTKLFLFLFLCCAPAGHPEVCLLNTIVHEALFFYSGKRTPPPPPPSFPPVSKFERTQPRCLDLWHDIKIRWDLSEGCGRKKKQKKKRVQVMSLSINLLR